MFDSIGRNPDEEFNRRRAAAATITLLGVGATLGLTLGVTTYLAVEIALVPIVEDELVELVTEDVLPDLPPPPPPAGRAEETEATPDDVVEDVAKLDPEVVDEIAPTDEPAGVDGGEDGGEPGGHPHGTPFGSHGGSGVRVFHWSELAVKKRIYPEYPEAARELHLGEQRCVAIVSMDEEGVPYDVNVEDCPKVFQLPTSEAILKWRWYPPRDGKTPVEARTSIAVIYKVR